MMHLFRWLALLAVLSLVACSENGPSSAGAAGGEAASQPESRTSAGIDRVETQRVTLGAIHTSMAASGAIQAKRVTEIGAEVSGRLVEVLVDVGDEVEEGDPLFRIDARPYELGLAEARAGLALARAESQNAAHEVERVAKLIE